MKEKFLWCETEEVGILDESSRLGAEIILLKMRQSSALEAVGDTITLDILLAYTSDDLGNVDEGALRSGGDHCLDAVRLA